MAKYKYLLSYADGANVQTDVQFFPLEDKVGIKYVKEKDKFYFVKELSGSLIFHNDAKNAITDYDKLMNISDTCTNIYVEILKQVGGRWVSWWTGAFMRFDCKVDEDLCRITVTPKRDDEFTDLEEILDKEVNVLYDGTEVVVEIQNSSPDPTISGYPVLFYELITFVDERIISDAIPAGTQWIFPHEPMADGGRPYYYNDPYPGYSRLANPLAPPDPSPLPMPPPDNCVWELYTVQYECLDAGTKLFRITTTMFTNFFLFWKTDLGCVPLDTTFRPVTDGSFGNLQICKYRRHPYYIDNTIQFFYDLDTMSFNYTGGANFANKALRSGRMLKPVIENMLSPKGLAYQSEFFNSTTNPITGEQNKLNNLTLVPISEVSNTPLSNRAGREMLSLNQVLTDLGVLFNVGYTVEDGVLIVEHLKYFENGGSYTGSKLIGIDLTQLINTSTKTTYISKSNKYEYNTDVLVGKEVFKNYTGEMNIQTDTANTDVFMPLCNADFSQMEITYDNCRLNNNVKERVTTKITTDWIKLMFNYDAQLRGFCLFATEMSPETEAIPGKKKPGLPGPPRPPGPIHGRTFSNDVYVVSNEYSELSNTYMPNGHLSWSSLHLNYWKYGRVRPNGYMIGMPMAFLSYEKLKIQNELTFHICDTPFYPEELIVTELGVGEVESAEEDFKSETVKVKLKYYD